MKIKFTALIVEEEITRSSITVDHIIIYPDYQIILNNKGGSSMALPISGLSKGAQAAFDAFVSELSLDVNDEYVSGAVTARAQAAAVGAQPAPDRGLVAAQDKSQLNAHP